MKSFLLALQFLTIIPLRVHGSVSENEVARSSLFFPLVGALQGIAASLAAVLFLIIFPASVTSGLVVGLLIAVGGGFHVDGLADTFDGLSVKSTGDPDRDRQKRLSVMKDPATGAIGVTAIMFSILLKYLLIEAILKAFPIREGLFSIFLMPVLSKWGMVAAMFHGKSARDDGLGKLFITGAGAGVFGRASLLIAFIFLLVMPWIGKTGMWVAVIFFLTASLALYALCLLWALLCQRAFGGLTGDNIGALGEISDILFLAGAYLFIGIFFQG